MGLLEMAEETYMEAHFTPPYAANDDSPHWRWKGYAYTPLVIDYSSDSGTEFAHRVRHPTEGTFTVPYDSMSVTFEPTDLCLWLSLGRPSPSIIEQHEFMEGDLQSIAALVDAGLVDIATVQPHVLRVLVAMNSD